MGLLNKLKTKYFGGVSNLPTLVDGGYSQISLIGPYGGTTGLSLADPSENTVVAAAINKLADALTFSDYHVHRNPSGAAGNSCGEDGVIEVPEHPFHQLFNNPAGDWTRGEVLRSIVGGLVASGNAYLQVKPDGLVVHDWRNVRPPILASEPYYVTDRTSGKMWSIPRSGMINLRWSRGPGIAGKGPLTVDAIGELMTDKEAQQYTATMMRNMGVPGLMMTPNVEQSADVDSDVIDKMQKDIERAKHLGRGNAIIFRDRWDFFEPQARAAQRFNLRDIRYIPEERILACIGVPPSILNIGSGSEHAQIGSAQAQLRQEFWEATIMPMAHYLAEQLTKQILQGVFGATPDYAVCANFDRSPIVQRIEGEAQLRTADLASRNYGAGLIGLREARMLMGYVASPPSDLRALDAGSGYSGGAEMGDLQSERPRTMVL